MANGYEICLAFHLPKTAQDAGSQTGRTNHSSDDEVVIWPKGISLYPSCNEPEYQSYCSQEDKDVIDDEVDENIVPGSDMLYHDISRSSESSLKENSVETAVQSPWMDLVYKQTLLSGKRRFHIPRWAY